jgi:NTP pyrophosphatase (non-canonical NTP hydrolase)
MGELPKRPWHTGEDGAAIFDADGHRILDVGRRRAELAKYLVEVVNLAGQSFCMWCGELSSLDRLADPEGAKVAVVEHLLACEKHPLRQVEGRVLEEAARADAARAQVERMRGALEEAGHLERQRMPDEALRILSNAVRAALSLSDSEGPRPDPWPTVTAFAALMRQKLDENRAKKGGREGWINDTPQALLARLREETAELEDARQWKGDDGPLVGSYARALAYECADVANFAMMIADVVGGLLVEPNTPKAFASFLRVAAEAKDPTPQAPRCESVEPGTNLRCSRETHSDRKHWNTEDGNCWQWDDRDINAAAAGPERPVGGPVRPPRVGTGEPQVPRCQEPVYRFIGAHNEIGPCGNPLPCETHSHSEVVG